MFLSLFFANAQSKFKPLTNEEFASYITKSGVQLLDVRAADEYNEGHIPGAINVDVQSADFQKIASSKLDPSKPVALYCRGGVRSKKAAGILEKIGYTGVDLDKGFKEWQGAVNKL